MLLNFQSFNEGKKTNSLLDSAMKAASALKSKSKDAADLVDDFINDFAQSKGSACEMWMKDKAKKELTKFFADDTHDFKCVTVDTERKDAYDKKVDAMKKQGWKIYDEEHNMEQTDIIFYRFKSKKLRNIDQKVGVFENLNEGLNVAGQPAYVLNAELLHYSQESKTFSTEVSDLGREFNPLYKGREEIIIIMNPVTKVQVEYVKEGEKRDAEHELMYTIYKPSHNSIPSARGTKLLVFND